MYYLIYFYSKAEVWAEIIWDSELHVECTCRCSWYLYNRIYIKGNTSSVEASWNVMAHAQKPDLVFRRNGRFHLNRPEDVRSVDYCQPRLRISGSNAGYTMFWGSVKGTGYTLHLPVSPSLPLLCVTVCHHISTGVCCITWGTSKLVTPVSLGHSNDTVMYLC
jgi:hypothetical protein